MGPMGVIHQQNGPPAVDLPGDGGDVRLPAEIVGAGEVHRPDAGVPVHGGGDLPGGDGPGQAGGRVVLRAEPGGLPVQEDAGVDQGHMGVAHGQEPAAPALGRRGHGQDGQGGPSGGEAGVSGAVEPGGDGLRPADDPLRFEKGVGPGHLGDVQGEGQLLPQDAGHGPPPLVAGHVEPGGPPPAVFLQKVADGRYGHGGSSFLW